MREASTYSASAAVPTVNEISEARAGCRAQSACNAALMPACVGRVAPASRASMIHNSCSICPPYGQSFP